MFQKITFVPIAIALFGIAVLIGLEYGFAYRSFPVITILALLTTLIVLALLIYRKLVLTFKELRKDIRGGNQQLHPLFFIHQKLSFRKPLPSLRGYAASPDLLALLIQLVEESQPMTIVEAGSGVSTLVNAYLLEKQSKGKVYSLDDDPKFGGLTQQTITDHELTTYAEVVIAPLETHSIGGQNWRWYGTKALLGKVKSIDLLIVDGPPSTIQKQARYPALPLLLAHLSPQAVILVDDCNRQEDRETVERWLREYPEFKGRFHALEKGAYVLRRKG